MADEQANENESDSQRSKTNLEVLELATTSRERWGHKIEFIFACIGFAVGYGNFWRFPYLCFKNGGGAFLIPYIIFLLFGGVPLFFMELSIGQFFQEGPIKAWRKICPSMSGIGIAMIAVSFLVSIYYNVILAWSVYFLYSSFMSDLPWTGCHHTWNTINCYNGTLVNGTGISPSREFLVHKVLELTNSIDEPGSLNLHLTVSLLVAWVLVYFCIWRGIRTTGKVVYVTATLPYVILLVLFIKGLTLPGARDGIMYYITPQWDRLADPAVWIAAASQILYSLTIGFGVIITFASYNKHNNNIYRDSLIISLANCATSIFAGFVIFTFVGFMAYVQGKTVPEVASQGPGLVFIVYPEALAQLPYPHIWSVIFFLMLVALGIDSQFGQVEVVAAAIIEHYPKHLRRYRELVVLVICTIMFLIGLSCVTQGGMYVFNLFDSFSCGFSLLFVVITEMITIGWIYGAQRFANDIRDMIGYPVSVGWVICWKVISPLVVILIFIMNLVQYKPITYEGKTYPVWAEGLGWIITFASVLWIPGTAIYRILTSKGTFVQKPSQEAIKCCNGSPDSINISPQIQLKVLLNSS